MARRELYIQPSKKAREVASSALERRRKLPKSKRCCLTAREAGEAGIGSGIMRARDISNGKRINAYQVKAFFDRHATNYRRAKAKGTSWEDSKALQAWDIWGGEPLRKQVEDAVAKDRKANSNPRRPRRVIAGRQRQLPLGGLSSHLHGYDALNDLNDALVKARTRDDLATAARAWRDARAESMILNLAARQLIRERAEVLGLWSGGTSTQADDLLYAELTRDTKPNGLKRKLMR